MDEDLRDAIERSALRDVLTATVTSLILDPVGRQLQQGTLLRLEGDPDRHLHLVVDGVVRLYVTATDGRTVTVRHARRGSLIGVASLFCPDWHLPVAIQTATVARVVDLSPAMVSATVDDDPRLARALLRELSHRVLSFVDQIGGTVFAPVRQRVARHLLDLALRDPVRGPGDVDVSHAAVAAAVGTVREVVTRTLADLRGAGLITTARGRITILDVEGLAVVAAGQDDPGGV